MRNLHQLIARTDMMRKINARYVRLHDLKAGYNAQGKGFVAAITSSSHAVGADGKLHRVEAPSKYVTEITFVDNKLNCIVGCSCPDFMYVHEVALHDKGAAAIEYSNGAPPVVKNPKMVPSICKHIVAVYEKIKHKLPKK